MLRYLFESWVWSIGGLVFGYVIGRTDREVRDIKKKVEGSDDDN
jgi:hypothetical protein